MKKNNELEKQVEILTERVELLTIAVDILYDYIKKQEEITKDNNNDLFDMFDFDVREALEDLFTGKPRQNKRRDKKHGF